MNLIKTPFTTGFFIFLFLLLFFKIQGAIPFAVSNINTNKANLFQVAGTATESQIPNTAILSFGVTKTSATVLDAQTQTNTNANNILEGFKTLGINSKDIKTTDYNVTPNYDYQTDSQKIKDYTVSQNLELKIKQLDKVNSVIDAATKNGANIVGNISFGFDDQTQKDLENKTRNEAISNAKAKAESMSQAAGMKLGRIVNIEEGDSNQPQPLVMSALRAPVGGGSPTNITTGQTTISTTVTISYETF